MAPAPILPIVCVMDETPFTQAREAMVRNTLEARGIQDLRVLKALRNVPRHRFLPETQWWDAYGDHPLPIGFGQTMSQPYIVAVMAEALSIQAGMRVLEVGSGCGYASAVLAHCGADVFALELEPALAARSKTLLADLAVTPIHVRCGDGALGWPEAAPYDGILVSCAAPEVQPAWWEQLAPGGRLVMPLGPAGWHQDLVCLTKGPQGEAHLHTLLPVAFVPLRRPG